jgi:hypothetical protein
VADPAAPPPGSRTVASTGSRGASVTANARRISPSGSLPDFTFARAT